MKIKVTDRDGKKHELEGDTNSTLMEILRDAGLDIEAACGGCCACATCHVYINDQWQTWPIDFLLLLGNPAEGSLDITPWDFIKMIL